MWIKFRHKVVFRLLKYPFKLFLFLKYNFKAIDYPLEDKPYFILSNHLTTLDPFMLSCSFNRPIYFVCSKDLYTSKFGKLITYLVQPIYKNKNVHEIGPIKECIKACKENATVCVFPEGNRSYDGNICFIDKSIAKMAKLMKVDLVIYNIVGGYGIDPRWSYKSRRGKSYGMVREVIPYEQVKTMDTEALYEKIISLLNVEIDHSITYKSKNAAEGLERVFYLCPVCGHTQTIKTRKNKIMCENCDLTVQYNSNLLFESQKGNFRFKTVKDWWDYQLDYVKNYKLNDEVIYTDEMMLYEVNDNKKILIYKGKMTFSKNSFKFCSSDIVINVTDVFSSTVLGKNKLNIYLNDKTYQIKGNNSFNALKYMQMYYHIKHQEEGDSEYFGM